VCQPSKHKNIENVSFQRQQRLAPVLMDPLNNMGLLRVSVEKQLCFQFVLLSSYSAAVNNANILISSWEVPGITFRFFKIY
jgi:hypothetical protein